MELRNNIYKYFESHPIDDTAKNKYSQVCKKFGIDVKRASYFWIKYKELNNWMNIDKIPYSDNRNNNVKITNVNKEGVKTINIPRTEYEIKTLEDLLAVCEIDTRQWQIESWQCKKWDLGIKDAEGNIKTKDLYSVTAKLKPVTVDNSLEKQKAIILEELFKEAPLFNTHIDKKSKNDKKSFLLELALFDVHFGKLAHREESGEDYDLKIAVNRYNDAIDSLLGRINIQNIDRILLPIGQDLINVDNLNSTTTRGTPQDCDSRFFKIVRTVKDLLIKTINRLVDIAPVDVVICVGNHDEQTSFMIGEILEAYFSNHNLVNVYNDASLRKYYHYGNTSIMFTHGDKEKFNELGMIFAAENPFLWAAAGQRYIQIGHFHHNKLQVLQKQEFQGFQVQVIPSLSGSDAWHRGKGYHALKQAKAFLYDYTEGLIGEFTYTAKEELFN